MVLSLAAIPAGHWPPIPGAHSLCSIAFIHSSSWLAPEDAKQNITAVGNEDVRRFDVAMNDSS